PYLGQEDLARLASHFISQLFLCPEYPQSSLATRALLKLPFFIAYALYRAELHPAVMFSALVLLQRLKSRFPLARGLSGHQLFISAFRLSSKVMCDYTYSAESWCIVAQGIFTAHQLNQMEREICKYLDWEITVSSLILSSFEKKIRANFWEMQSTYPDYAAAFVS
ncbi:hypothetical protein HYPSUDRAFT_108914, partial [Hypholoma sublateritium FD-334 SS-4]